MTKNMLFKKHAGKETEEIIQSEENKDAKRK